MIKCLKCKFVKGRGSTGYPPKSILECRRHAPIKSSKEGIADLPEDFPGKYWPIVNENDGCGDGELYSVSKQILKDIKKAKKVIKKSSPELKKRAIHTRELIEND